MPYPAQIREFVFGDQHIRLLHPDPLAVRYNHEQKSPGTPPPYWARIWPASIGLCYYAIQQADVLKDKRVLELGAGLGLPSLLVSRYARETMCTDIAPEAIPFVKASAVINQQNVQVKILDWKEAAQNETDLVMMSDVNYDPVVFDDLQVLIKELLDKNREIWLSTPQRLAASVFAENLLPYCTDRQNYLIEEPDDQTEVTVFALKKS
jgi:predicted nicotinamide N-methyase